VRDYGPAPGGPAAASRGPAVRRIHLGLHPRDPAMPRCLPRTGGSATAIWRNGWPPTGAQVPPDRRTRPRWTTRTSRSTPSWLAATEDLHELAVSGTRRDGHEQLSRRRRAARPRKRCGYLQARFLDQREPEARPGALPLQKSARIINALAGREECDLLDVGCGPATLMRLVRPNIHYYGIDIAIHDPAPHLIEADILKEPIRFADKRFSIVAALGLFEYVGASQEQKFSEIAQLLSERGRPRADLYELRAPGQAHISRPSATFSRSMTSGGA